ncbi:Annexin-B12 (Annexin-12) (Annexin XII) [Planoprotostelium fungivorum]|uniref:Annexin n=1 Tax=Planoprotostelium fungivorum TaxID=1890364 RepID=A0A2P6NI60_9EUKA|nr:Annexin-B12 (Annexin-12) (Annexin XII) [Planoprotostelium fungivorum]
MSYRDAADTLYKAMKGFGTDEKKVTQVLSSLPHDGRVAIASEFERLTGKNLQKELESELSGRYRAVCKRLAKSIPEVKADYLKDAMKGLGTKDHPLIDAVCHSTNYEIAQINQIYAAKYGGDLRKDVKSETSGNFQKVLLAILEGRRDESPYVNEQQAAIDADVLYHAGEKKFGTDDSTFVSIITTRSSAQLYATNLAYQRLRGKSLHDAIKNETSGDYCDALLALTTTRDRYFVDRLKEAFKGLGTNDDLLVYIMTAHDRQTLAWFATTYAQVTGKTLIHDIEKETSGDYEKVLVALLKSSRRVTCIRYKRQKPVSVIGVHHRPGSIAGDARAAKFSANINSLCLVAQRSRELGSCRFRGPAVVMVKISFLLQMLNLSENQLYAEICSKFTADLKISHVRFVSFLVVSSAHTCLLFGGSL